MVCLTISPECSRGACDKCSGGKPSPPGTLGGTKCTCPCHHGNYKEKDSLMPNTVLGKSDGGDKESIKVQLMRNCSRCGQIHSDLVFHRLTHPCGDLTHWTRCPTNGEPILLKVVAENGH